MGKINSKKVEYEGIEFDSQLEKEYYEYLKRRDDVESINLQPDYTFLEDFQITCGRCDHGVVPSPKTGKSVKCKLCRGTGKRNRRKWTYTADFKVWYKDGRVEVVDVKGFANERFPLVRKMFEYQQGHELIVIKKQKGKWVRK